MIFMKNLKLYLTLALIILFLNCQFAQKQHSTKLDTSKVKNLNEVIISAPRNDIPLRQMPSSASIVSEETIKTFSKSIQADEALRLVPGVRIDNGTGGSRVHLYIRGQGVLSETGFRGIQILIDGIPVNDPGGYAPDLYDVDWNNVKQVEVVKGLAASMYGGSGYGGVVNIISKDGGLKPVNTTIFGSAGSYGFWKSSAQLDGTSGNVNYLISYSHMQSNGYRIHQAYMGDNFYEKISWTPSVKVKITQLLSYTNYFNQNSEGINLGRYDTVGHRAANTDAVPFNEFHLTQRLTGATIGKFIIDNNQNLTVKGFFRINNYKETSNNGADYKPYINPGLSAQYNFNYGKENLINHFSIGADFQSQTTTEHWFAATKDPDRIDSPFSLTTFDNDNILIDQTIRQRSTGIYLIDKIDIYKKLFATLNLRYDDFYNQLVKPWPDTLNQSGSRHFNRTTFRIGLAYDVLKSLNIYANYGTGFLSPSNNELYNNPDAWGGFNSSIKPSTSQGGELGLRGNVGDKINFDVTGFFINTKNGFYRFSIPGRGNNTAFFRNKDESRWGTEIYLAYSPVEKIKMQLAYTYSHFQYKAHDNISAHWIPQCPEHKLNAEISVNINKNFTLNLGTELQSKWCIQVDDSIYEHFNENGIIRDSWVKGFNVYNAELKYIWKLGKLNGDISFYAKNIFDEQYFGFTEPNNGPDYNSFQAAPGREFFASLRLKF